MPTAPQDNRNHAQTSNHAGGHVAASALKRAESESRRLARSHYENFLIATVLLPRRLRQPFYNVYAFCRTADDLADESASPAAAMEALSRFQQQLDDTFAGKPRDNLFVALAHTIKEFDLPQQPFDQLLDAFRQDQQQNRYRDIDELLQYCARSANPVGRIVLRLGDSLDDQSGQLSDQICSGLQLANFCQDVARDHAIGRIYLPQEEMDRHGVREEMLSQSHAPQPLRKLLESECDRAEGFFRRGLPLASKVPRWLAADVKLFAYGGMATLDAIRRIDFDVLAQRPTVPRHQQMWLLVKAAARRL